MRLPSHRRGQTLALLALTTLLLVMMVMMTVSIASRIRDRIELQMVADASAYSNAVATARAYNTAALLNRTMVSQWAAMCGISALHAWGSIEYGYFRSFAGLVMELNEPNTNFEYPGNCTGNGYYNCPARWGTDPNPRNPPLPPDCDEERRNQLRGEFNELNNAGDAATWGNGYGQLDRGVVQQVRDLWQSMDDLGRVQVVTQRELRRVLVDQQLAQNIKDRTGTLEQIDIHNRDIPSNVAVRETDGASPIGQAPAGDPAPAAHMRAMVQAIMGTRGDPFMYRDHHVPAAFAQWMVANDRGPGIQHLLGGGAWIRYDWFDVTRNSSHPGAYGQMSLNPFSQSLRSQPPTVNTTYEQPNNNPWDCNQCYENYQGSGGFASPLSEPGDLTPWRGPAMTANFDGLRGVSWAGNLRVQYRAPNGLGCGPNDSASNVGDVTSFVWYTVPVGPEEPRHYVHHHRPTVDERPGHGHAGEIDSSLHWMGNNNTRNSVLPYSIGFAFPSIGERGAGNAWGQPKTPVLMSRRQVHKDPWALLVPFRFSQNGPGSRLDLQKGFAGPVALGNAIAYYHRTANGNAGGWEEAPSFLNPFWRATLTPLDIDERTQGTGPGQDTTIVHTPAVRGDDARRMLTGMNKISERDAFNALTAAGWVGGQ